MVESSEVHGFKAEDFTLLELEHVRGEVPVWTGGECLETAGGTIKYFGEESFSEFGLEGGLVIIIQCARDLLRKIYKGRFGCGLKFLQKLLVLTTVGLVYGSIFGELFTEDIGKFVGGVNIRRIRRFGNVSILEIEKEGMNIV